jgi:hypothetical protein
MHEGNRSPDRQGKKTCADTEGDPTAHGSQPRPPHRNILIVTGQIATGPAIPDQFLTVFGAPFRAGLVLAAVAIAMLGTLLPAQWAARVRVAEMLQAE